MRSLAPDNIGFNNLAVNKEKEENKIDRNEEDRNEEDCNASAGTFAGVPGAITHPDPFAFAAPPLSFLPPQHQPRLSTTTS